MMLDVRNPKKMLAEQEDDLRNKASAGQKALNLRNDPAFKDAMKAIEADVRADLETIDPMAEPAKLLRAQIKLELIKELVVNLNFTAADGKAASERMGWLQRMVEKKRKAH